MAATSGDATRGKGLTYTCRGCHGVTGYKNAYPSYHVPKIAGQHPAYFALALFTCAGASLYLAYLGLDIVSAVTATATSLFNIGPGLGTVGPTRSFAHIPTSGKVVLSLCMILGRLEFMTLLVLCLPDFWKR